MDIRLPKLLRKGAAKVISMALKATTGYSAHIHLDKFHAQIKKGRARAHIDLLADMSEQEFRKIFGYSVNIHLDEFDAQIRNGQAHAHIDIIADMSEEDFKDLFAKITKHSK